MARRLWVGMLLVPVAGMAAKLGSGLVVGSENEVYFCDLKAGVWKIDGHGQLSLVYKRPAEFLSIDPDGGFAKSGNDSYRRITPKGAVPALFVSRGDPIAIGKGNLFFASSKTGGPLHVMRQEPSGESFVVGKVPDNTRDAEKLRRVNGIGVGPDGSVYIAGNHTVRRVTPQGTVSTVVGPLKTAPDCAKAPGVKKGWRPYMRGIAVDASGSVYAAATGCGVVMKISPEGEVATVLKAEANWSPTAVALAGRDLYVLENALEGPPAARVRKLASDGTVTVVGSTQR
jgi:sugar lactone lactonase YvrE